MLAQSAGNIDAAFCLGNDVSGVHRHVEDHGADPSVALDGFVLCIRVVAICAYSLEISYSYSLEISLQALQEGGSSV
jgi:hypothetical protein